MSRVGADFRPSSSSSGSLRIREEPFSARVRPHSVFGQDRGAAIAIMGGPGSNNPGSCILFTVVKCDRGGRARPSPALVRKETAKSFRVVAPAFPEGRESPNSCLGLHKRRARIRKNGPTTEEGGSPSSECYYYEAGLRGSGRLQGAAGGVRGSYRRALRRS